MLRSDDTLMERMADGLDTVSKHFSITDTGWFFLTGSALKVLSVEDGKIPTKKVKVGVKTSHILCDIPSLSLFF